MLYPLKFKPLFFEKIWGGNRLKTLFNKEYSDIKNCGESWEISDVENRNSVIDNGFLAGNELAEIIEVYMEDLVGESVFSSYGIKFPLLFKFIDTDDYLSLQVHPGFSSDKPMDSSGSKAELWYIVDAEPDAEIILGLKKDTSKEEFLEHLNNNSIKEILNIEKPVAGDVYFIQPGTIHAIGKGVTLLEIQQSFDVTYRLYDWNRKGLDGKPRELHLENALKAVNFEASNNKINVTVNVNSSTNLVKNKYFTSNIIEFDNNIQRDYIKIGSFVVYSCLEGKMDIKYKDGMEKLAKGQHVLLPAELKEVELIPASFSRIVETYID